jgi:membrane protein
MFAAGFRKGIPMTNVFLWFFDRISSKKISIHAAQVAFFILVSVFPFFMFLITLLQYTPISEDIILNMIPSIVPDAMCPLVTDWLKETYRAASGTILSVTVFFTLWSSSRGFSGIICELENIYEVKQCRSFVGRRIHALFDTVVFTVMLVISLILLVYANPIRDLIHRIFPFLSNLDIILFLSRSAGAFLIFVLYFLVLYRFVPNRKTTFKKELPGAGLAAFFWIGFSYLYSIYIDYHSTFSSVYGSLTYIVLLMLWIYGSIIIIFLGALFNQYLQEEKKLNLIRSLKQLPGLLRSFPESKN